MKEKSQCRLTLKAFRHDLAVVNQKGKLPTEGVGGHEAACWQETLGMGVMIQPRAHCPHVLLDQQVDKPCVPSPGALPWAPS